MEEPKDEEKEKTARRIRRKIGAQFLEGLLVVVPIVIAIWVLVWVFSAIDGILQPTIRAILGRRLPGVGLAIGLVLIYVVGVIADNVLGRRLIRFGESLLARVPLFRYVYTGVKEFLRQFSAPGKGGFAQVVMVEFPKNGMKAIGFITNEVISESGEKIFSVFIPIAGPNPTTGFLEIVKEEDIVRTTISVEEAVKMVVSAGAISSPEVKDKLMGKG